jgi:hypothetical protein
MPEYRVSGALFEVDRQGGPAFTGFIEINGEKTMLALWPKTSAKGQNYFQISEDKKRVDKMANRPKAASPFKPKPSITSNDPRDDGEDIPF